MVCQVPATRVWAPVQQKIMQESFYIELHIHSSVDIFPNAVFVLVQVFGITHDPFIVYSSHMFAILSLRALYGFVNTIMSELRYLDKAVALVLGFIGAKMLADFGGYHVPTTASLGVVITTLAGGVAASLWLPAKADSS